jgi:putative transposase
MKYEFIRGHRTHYPVYRLCALLDVSTSGYYDWLDRPESNRVKRHQKLLSQIRAIHADHHYIYGSPRIHKALVKSGVCVGKNTIARLMQAASIQSRLRKRFKLSCESKAVVKPAQNVLARQFNAAEPNTKWVCDVTNIETREGWVFLATVMDLYSRKIIGWSMSHRNTSSLVMNALQMALDKRKPAKGLIIHSDQGTQYSSSDYQNLLNKYCLIASMSRKGNCWDNAVMESFFHSLKTEWTYFEEYRTREEARSSLFIYIELFYNRKRSHSSIGYNSPMQYEAIEVVHY